MALPLPNTLADIARCATQSGLHDLFQEARDLQMVLFDVGLHHKHEGDIGRNLNSVATLNRVRAMLRPLGNDLGVSTRDRHQAAVHTRELLEAIEDSGQPADYEPHFRRLKALYRSYYPAPVARRR